MKELDEWDRLPHLEAGTKMELLDYDDEGEPSVSATLILDPQGNWILSSGSRFPEERWPDESASHYARRVVSMSGLASRWSIRVLRPSGEAMTYEELYGRPL